MREIDITEKCLEFIDSQGQRVSDKFFQLIEIIGEVKIVHTNFESGLKSHLTPKSPKGDFFKLLIFSCSPIEPVPMKIGRLGVKTTKISSLKAF